MNKTIYSDYMVKALAALLALVMVIASLPLLAGVAYAADENDIAYIFAHEEKGSLEYYITTYDGEAKTPAVTIEGLTEGTDFSVEYSHNNEPGYAKVIITGMGSYTGTFETYFLIAKATDQNADRLFGSSTRIRYAGSSRYDTSLKIADALKKALGVTKFDNIVIAYGGNYPDALSGGYLAKVKNAPIITVDKSHETSVINYIKANLKEDGAVYILGGTKAVSATFQTKLESIEKPLAEDAAEDAVAEKMFEVKRLAGSTRYETNLLALEEAGVDKEALLVCSGAGYADSLSASAVGLPILLVGSSLTAQQKTYLAGLESDYFYAIGGTKAVSTKSVTDIKAVANKDGNNYTGDRLAGSSRYDTSTLVAKTFFDEEISNVVLAYAQNFPDGLSGGPLAMAIGAPLVLTDSKGYSAAKKYVGTTWIKRSITLGGTSLIPDKTITNIMTY